MATQKFYLNERRTPASRRRNVINDSISKINSVTSNLTNSLTPLLQTKAQQGLTATGRAIARNERDRLNEKIFNSAQSLTTQPNPASGIQDIALNRQQEAIAKGTPSIRSEANQSQQEALDAIIKRKQAELKADELFATKQRLKTGAMYFAGKTPEEIKVLERQRAEEVARLEQESILADALVEQMGGTLPTRGGAGGAIGQKISAEGKGQRRDIRDLQLDETQRQLELGASREDIDLARQDLERTAIQDAQTRRDIADKEASGVPLTPEEQAFKSRDKEGALKEAQTALELEKTALSTEVIDIQNRIIRGETVSDEDKAKLDRYNQIKTAQAKPVAKVPVYRKTKDGRLIDPATGKEVKGKIPANAKILSDTTIDTKAMETKTTKQLRSDISSTRKARASKEKRLTELATKELEVAGDANAMQAIESERASLLNDINILNAEEVSMQNLLEGKSETEVSSEQKARQEAVEKQRRLARRELDVQAETKIQDATGKGISEIKPTVVDSLASTTESIRDAGENFNSVIAPLWGRIGFVVDIGDGLYLNEENRVIEGNIQGRPIITKDVFNRLLALDEDAIDVVTNAGRSQVIAKEQYKARQKARSDRESQAQIISGSDISNIQA